MKQICLFIETEKHQQMIKFLLNKLGCLSYVTSDQLWTCTLHTNNWFYFTPIKSRNCWDDGFGSSLPFAAVSPGFWPWLNHVTVLWNHLASNFVAESLVPLAKQNFLTEKIINTGMKGQRSLNISTLFSFCNQCHRHLDIIFKLKCHASDNNMVTRL